MFKSFETLQYNSELDRNQQISLDRGTRSLIDFNAFGNSMVKFHVLRGHWPRAGKISDVKPNSPGAGEQKNV